MPPSITLRSTILLFAHTISAKGGGGAGHGIGHFGGGRVGGGRFGSLKSRALKAGAPKVGGQGRGGKHGKSESGFLLPWESSAGTVNAEEIGAAVLVALGVRVLGV